MSFSNPSIILSQIFTPSSLKPQAPSYRSDLVKLFPLEFLKFRPIVKLVWNKWFVWLHTIWVCNVNTWLLSFRIFIFLHPFTIIWLLHSFCINCALFLWPYDLPPPIHVAFCWDIVITIWYQVMPLVTCWMNSWLWFSSTRACLPIWLKRKRLPVVANPWCHMPVTLSIIPFKLFQNVTFDECVVDWA